MNSIERITAAVTFQKSDRIPVIAQIFGHSALISGHNLSEYVNSGEIAAKCQINALKRYGYDAVFAIFDTCIETEAAGSHILYREDLYPAVQSYALTPNANMNLLKIPDPYKDGRMPELLKAVKILSQEVGNETLVVGCIMGPMTLATQLTGIEDALYLAMDDSEQFEKLLDYATEVGIAFGTAQMEAGAHLPLIFDPSASPAVVPPSFFREFILPRHKKIFESFKSAGSVANWLHITGSALPILPFYAESGVNIANIDYCVDPVKAQEALPNVCLDGNIKSFAFVEVAPDEIRTEAEKIIQLFTTRGGFILSSGCEIPPESKPENIAALVDAAS
ncbi:MAG: uroporphyrinogen decarboxylase [Desulfobacteraceae bacterium]|nr:uroporphyrinogen decarboxylase [Desulfobacteraceae bacterium]